MHRSRDIDDSREYLDLVVRPKPNPDSQDVSKFGHRLGVEDLAPEILLGGLNGITLGLTGYIPNRN